MPLAEDDAPAADPFLDKSRQATPSLLREFIDFVRFNKKWWLIPLLVALGLMGLLIGLSGSVLAPFLYPLF